MKMKRIAYTLIYLFALFFTGCSDKIVITEVDNPDPNKKNSPDKDGSISLRVVVPKNSITTYAGEDATNLENRIDTLFVELYQGVVPVLMEDLKFSGSELKKLSASNDSIVSVDTIVSNLNVGSQVTARVYANRKNVEVITTDIPLPVGTPSTSFYMSGEGPINYTDGKYCDTIRLIRNVAKLRINISKHSVVFPSDLSIDYNNVKIQVLDAANQTSAFGGAVNDIASSNYIDYIERTTSALRNSPSLFSPVDGGQIDSLYLYENYRSVYTEGGLSGTATQVKFTIPTNSPTEGPKTGTYAYTLFTDNSFDIIRNTIYTLDVKVQGQGIAPLITLDILPWDDIRISGDIPGTYLTMEESELTFNSSGEAYIDFCTNAQALYLNFDDFNNANTSKIGFNDDIVPIGIEAADYNLAPLGFQDGQILLDKQHCGRLGFKLNLSKFPKFPNVTFGGSVCIRAGNIVKCLAFTGRRTYDAHFIVGEDLLESGNTFTSADVTTDDGGNWLEVSTQKLYTSPTTSYNGAATPLYLHLDENLTGSTRTGSVTVVSGGMEKKINIAQLSALPVGRFGYLNPVLTSDLNEYDNQLYTEQLYEFSSLLPYKTNRDDVLPARNYIYNGLGGTTSEYYATNYNNATFNYSSTQFQAMNYCAYKNRDENGDGILDANEIKWHLPSQAQLSAMWISFESYKNTSTSNFYTGKDSAAYWSATANNEYKQEVQYMNFIYGNIGHYYKDYSGKYWTRCVRSGKNTDVTTRKMVSGNVIGGLDYPTVDFSEGMPLNSYTNVSKNGQRASEQSSTNATLFRKLRIALSDVSVGTDALDDAYTKCLNYSEGSTSSGWRLPTQRELQAIWILQEEIHAICPAFNYFVDNYYWSSTYASETYAGSVYASAWCLFGNRVTPGEASNMPHLPKSSLLKARCVREE